MNRSHARLGSLNGREVVQEVLNESLSPDHPMRDLLDDYPRYLQEHLSCRWYNEPENSASMGVTGLEISGSNRAN